MPARVATTRKKSTSRTGAAKQTSRNARRPKGASGVRLGEETARSMVLFGAAQVFTDVGVRACSVEHLLEASGVSRRTFYRLYESKEDVVLALYQLGTARLLALCAEAGREEKDPLRFVERCIDVHLDTARDQGRLVFVLGGEAQRRESPLHARRMQVHHALVELISERLQGDGRERIDPFLLEGIVLALEGTTRTVLEEGDEGRAVRPESLARVRRSMLRLATASLAGEGPRVAPLPVTPRR